VWGACGGSGGWGGGSLVEIFMVKIFIIEVVIAEVVFRVKIAEIDGGDFAKNLIVLQEVYEI
jgi:hypothetical protein